METRLRAGQSRTWDSVSERVNLFSSLQPLNPLWGASILIFNRYRWTFTGIRAVGRVNPGI